MALNVIHHTPWLNLTHCPSMGEEIPTDPVEFGQTVPPGHLHSCEKETKCRKIIVKYRKKQ